MRTTYVSAMALFALLALVTPSTTGLPNILLTEYEYEPVCMDVWAETTSDPDSSFWGTTSSPSAQDYADCLLSFHADNARASSSVYEDAGSVCASALAATVPTLCYEAGAWSVGGSSAFCGPRDPGDPEFCFEFRMDYTAVSAIPQSGSGQARPHDNGGAIIGDHCYFNALEPGCSELARGHMQMIPDEDSCAAKHRGWAETSSTPTYETENVQGAEALRTGQGNVLCTDAFWND